MEHFAAGFTGALVGLLLWDWHWCKRSMVARLAGPLLLRIGRRATWGLSRFSRGENGTVPLRNREVIARPPLKIHRFDFRQLFCSGATVLLYVLCVYLTGWRPMYTFLVAFLVVAVLRDSLDPIRVELRERGMVLSIQGRIAFVPFGRIAFVPFECVRYCQWMETSKKLVVQLGAIQERCSIHPQDAELITPLLARYVEVLDESGNPLFERREADGCSPPAPDAGDRGRVAEPVFARFQFTLRTLLVAAAAAGAASGWYAVVRGQTARQRAVAAKLDRFKPTVSWSRHCLRLLDFSRSPVKPGDDDLKLLEEQTGLRFLDLSFTNVTDGGLVHLGHLERLEYLSLGNTRITDAGLVRLHGLKNLNSVYLVGTGATPQGIAELRKALPGTTIVY